MMDIPYRSSDDFNIRASTARCIVLWRLVSGEMVLERPDERSGLANIAGKRSTSREHPPGERRQRPDVAAKVVEGYSSLAGVHRLAIDSRSSDRRYPGWTGLGKALGPFDACLGEV